MKLKKIIILVLFGIISLATIVTGESPVDSFPSAFLTEQIYTFEPVVEGTEVTHDFILQNKGTALLEIVNLKSG